MNRIKSLLGLFSIVLALMFYPLGAEAQTITVPPGTDSSVQLLGQVYIETGNFVKDSQNLDEMPIVAEKIATKYAVKIDTNVKLNNSDRRYLTKCMMYSVKQILRCSFRIEGADPDNPDFKPAINQALEEMTKQVEGKLAGATTVGDAVNVLETAFQ